MYRFTRSTATMTGAQFPQALQFGIAVTKHLNEKYGIDVLETFATQFAGLRAEGYLAEATAERLALTREGLMRVDSLLPRFFRPEHTNIRYT